MRIHILFCNDTAVAAFTNESVAEEYRKEMREHSGDDYFWHTKEVTLDPSEDGLAELSLSALGGGYLTNRSQNKKAR